MTGQELYDYFRSQIDDVVKPYLWSDTEVWMYMNDAYRMFVRMMGGVPDTTSKVTQVDIVKGEAEAEVSPLILKFRTARLLSTGRYLDIISEFDEHRIAFQDYGQTFVDVRDDRPGQVRYMITGKDHNERRGIVRWLRVPEADDVCQLSVLRLPLKKATPTCKFEDVREEHHMHFILWMKALAYNKQDADTFDRGRRDENDAGFRQYCDMAAAEWRRYSTNRTSVAYGGI
jgi:hypothetical protein